MLKLNPFFSWSFKQVHAYIEENNVPRNALLSQGYKSVGDWHSTAKSGDGDAGERAGRWQGKQKTECGLHKDFTHMKLKSKKKVKSSCSVTEHLADPHSRHVRTSFACATSLEDLRVYPVPLLYHPHRCRTTWNRPLNEVKCIRIQCQRNLSGKSVRTGSTHMHCMTGVFGQGLEPVYDYIPLLSRVYRRIRSLVRRREQVSTRNLEYQYTAECTWILSKRRHSSGLCVHRPLVKATLYLGVLLSC